MGVFLCVLLFLMSFQVLPDLVHLAQSLNFWVLCADNVVAEVLVSDHELYPDRLLAMLWQRSMTQPQTSP